MFWIMERGLAHGDFNLPATQNEKTMEFNQAFYDKVLKLLLSPRPNAAKAELLKLHGEILSLYKEKGWTEYPGPQESSVEAPSSASADTATERVKRIEKPVAPIKKDVRPSVIQSLNLKRDSPSPRPSPSVSPRIPHDTPQLKHKETSSGTKVHGSGESDVGIFERLEDKNLEVSDDEGAAPKKKLRRVVIADSSSENEEDKSSKGGNVGSLIPAVVVESPQPEKPPESDLVGRVQEREKRGNHSPSPSWADILCSVCKSSSQDADNAVMQCNECSKNYHQECHDPKIRTIEKNDPRFIFRCSSCVKKRSGSVGSGWMQTQSRSRDPTKDLARKQRDTEELANFKRAAEKRRADSPATTMQQHAQPANKGSSVGSVASKAADFLAKHKGLSSSSKATPKSPLGPNIGGSSSWGQKPGQPGMGLGRWAHQPPTSQGLMGLGKLAAGSAKSSSSSGNQGDFGKALAGQSTTMMAQADKRLQAMKKKAAQAKLARNLD